MLNGFGDAGEIAALSERAGRGSTTAPTCPTPPRSSAMMARCADELGAPDILVNNAGIQHVAPVDEFPTDKWDAIIAINLTAVFHTTRLAVPAMRAGLGPDHQHRQRAQPRRLAQQGAYVAAKHGVAGFTKAVALEAARDGVTVNCISPGYVWTTLVEAQIPDTMKARGLTREQVINDVLLAAQPTKRFVTPEEVAALALFLCRDEAGSITGANLSMDGGWTAALGCRPCAVAFVLAARRRGCRRARMIAPAGAR